MQRAKVKSEESQPCEGGKNHVYILVLHEKNLFNNFPVFRGGLVELSLMSL